MKKEKKESKESLKERVKRELEEERLEEKDWNGCKKVSERIRRTEEEIKEEEEKIKEEQDNCNLVEKIFEESDPIMMVTLEEGGVSSIESVETYKLIREYRKFVEESFKSFKLRPERIKEFCEIEKHRMEIVLRKNKISILQEELFNLEKDSPYYYIKYEIKKK